MRRAGPAAGAAAARMPDPYRVLFPIGLTWGVIGAGLWPLHAGGLIPWPGIPHRLLMIQGFEQSFVLGFLLTALPGFTRGERCRPLELVAATACALAFGACALAGAVAAAQGTFIASVLLLLFAAARRVRRAPVAPALEMMFVGFGLLLGLAGGLVQIAGAAGVPEPAPRFGERLVSLGMVLSLVLGVGGLLVPVFAGLRDPLVIPGIAGPHERPGRAVFYSALIALLALGFAAEGVSLPRVGAWLRATAASALLLMVWKLWRLPGRRELPAFALWGSGWMLLLGLWTLALAPGFGLGALHIVFIGGFGILTLGIGTRVVVAHGRHPIADERRMLTPLVVTLMAAALLARLGAEGMPQCTAFLLGVSGAAWGLGWIAWGARAGPRIVRTLPATGAARPGA